MDKGQKPLSHDEIWDDSVLIDSWNDALDEYKKYHSIHAKGGSVRDLEPEEDVALEIEESKSSEEKTSDGVLLVGEEAWPSETGAKGVPIAPPPQALLGSVGDESLKKLLMSWYYAGYYTGLFEGQRQGRQDDPPKS